MFRILTSFGQYLEDSTAVKDLLFGNWWYTLQDLNSKSEGIVFGKGLLRSIGFVYAKLIERAK
jgi:hypothetical protein